MLKRRNQKHRKQRWRRSSYEKGIQEEPKIEEARAKMRADLERKIREEERKDAKPEVKVKLPKLEIKKFKGNHLD